MTTTVTRRRRTTPARARLIADVRTGNRCCPLCLHRLLSPAARRLADILGEPDPIGRDAVLAYRDRLHAAMLDLKYGDHDRLDPRT